MNFCISDSLYKILHSATSATPEIVGGCVTPEIAGGCVINRLLLAKADYSDGVDRLLPCYYNVISSIYVVAEIDFQPKLIFLLKPKGGTLRKAKFFSQFFYFLEVLGPLDPPPAKIFAPLWV